MADIRVFCSGAFRAAHLALVPGFEATSGHRVTTAWGSSFAGSPTSIPDRMQRNEPVDVIVMAQEGLERLVEEGKIKTGTCVSLARSGIGVAVRSGATKPDVGTAAALRDALVACRSLAISTSASGIYLGKLFGRLGIAEEMEAKIVRAVHEPVGCIVARGEAEIGLQQVSELLPVAGIDFVGPLPCEIQETTVFSAGLAAIAREPEAARSLIDFLAGPQAANTIEKTGMEPAFGR